MESLAADIAKHNAETFDGGNLVHRGGETFTAKHARWLAFRDARVAAGLPLGRTNFFAYDASREQGG